ncbi:hypothetical protein PB2503_01492 [Parvularcula bermudensis HTCC2503]|uniref:Tail specific protease domain-containing protein n=1 Tax=Parvularcula bermudensis (strain ATCC BAA-594 / HTCC2503 / KCTC 12087) TaxID=314260 RepID=E0TBK2_PARBH|nr:S41 family peptidase [Parvularcula bermudensis]ADM08377.1 hypothetical protein PB2503_01492 [Parvularcula bermudensis HTCC2503]
MRAVRAVFIGAAALLTFPFAGCSSGGGGGGDDGVATSPTPMDDGGSGGSSPPLSAGDPQWRAGEYPPADDFKDRCAAPRSGVDSEGNVFPDQPGSLRDEQFWLRSWTHETYLFNDEVIDRDPADFPSAAAYFDVLKTEETFRPGKPKDEFHFSQPTADYLDSRNAVASIGYGAAITVVRPTPPREIRITATQERAPTAFVPGAQLVAVDGIDLVHGITTEAERRTALAALYPRAAGEVHHFHLRVPGEAALRTVTAQAIPVKGGAVDDLQTFATTEGRTGYIRIGTFGTYQAERDIFDAMSTLEAADIEELILDLRYNTGGILAIASQLSYMIAGTSRTRDKVFEGFRFNDDAGELNPTTGDPNTPFPFYDTGLGFSLTATTALPTLNNLDRVVILTSGETCSASESVLNGLRGIDFPIVVIGGGTCGKPFGFFPTDNCGTTYFTLQFEGINDKGQGGYIDGFIPADSPAPYGERLPGCAIEAAPSDPIGEAGDPLYDAALTYIETGSCPATPTSPLASAMAAGPQRSGAVATRAAIGLPLIPDRGISAGRARDVVRPAK